MSREKSSGISLSNKDASIVLGMVARDDRDHDIAAWFGVNQGRIAEVKAGSFGAIMEASAEQLPPKGPPGPKGYRLSVAVRKALEVLAVKGSAGLEEATTFLKDGTRKYNSNEM